MPVIRYEAECEECKGTGLLVTRSEYGGAAIECDKCEGLGGIECGLIYNEFRGRKNRQNITRVFKKQFGKTIGRGGDPPLESYGGITHEEWLAGEHFPAGSEPREDMCPAEFYDESHPLCPAWNQCRAEGGSFRDCSYYEDKDLCWTEWDQQFGEKADRVLSAGTKRKTIDK